MGIRSPLFPALLSLTCGVLLFFLFRYFAALQGGAPHLGEGYAVLVVDERLDDRCIRESLSGLGFGESISESSIEVPLDDFGVFRMIPLDSFNDEIEAFDPRNDGYAAKLRSFFVRDGKRFFFLPLDGLPGSRAANLEQQMAALLGEEEYAIRFLAQARPVFLYLALLAAVSAAALFLSRSRRLFVFQLPVLLAFGWAGSSAFAIAAILSGIWELLREPLKELSAASFRRARRQRREKDYAGTGFKGLWERLRPFRINLALALVFLGISAALSLAGLLPPFQLVIGCSGFFLVYYLSYRTEAARARKNQHIAFTPVLPIPPRAKTFSLFPFLLPFASGAVLAMILPGFSPFRERNAWHHNDSFADPQYFVSSEEYGRHIAFQRSFSYTTLDLEQEAIHQGGYLRYYLDDDGLVAGSTDGSLYLESLDLDEVPPFPLEKLMQFLIDYDTLGVSVGTSPLFNFKEWISVAMILAVCMLDKLRPRARYRKRVPVYGDKRIAS